LNHLDKLSDQLITAAIPVVFYRHCYPLRIEIVMLQPRGTDTPEATSFGFTLNGQSRSVWAVIHLDFFQKAWYLLYMALTFIPIWLTEFGHLQWWPKGIVLARWFFRFSIFTLAEMELSESPMPVFVIVLSLDFFAFTKSNESRDHFSTREKILNSE